jgi:RNA polymerase sigma factor (sigma-70 family)
MPPGAPAPIDVVPRPTILAPAGAGRHAGPSLASLPLPETDDFVELFRLHYPRLVRALVLSGSPRPTAEDLAQEAFARTFRHWRRVRRGPNPPGYLFRIAFRLLRRRGLAPTTALDDRAAPFGPALDDASADRIDLERSLAALPPRRRACAVMCWCLDVAPSEAAEALGVTAGTVRKQLELARRDLRAALEA